MNRLFHLSIIITFILPTEPVYNDRLDTVDNITGETEAEPYIVDEDIDMMKLAEGIRLMEINEDIDMMELTNAPEVTILAMAIQDPITVPQRISLSNTLAQASQSITLVTPFLSTVSLPVASLTSTLPSTIARAIQEEQQVIAEPAVHGPINRDEFETEYRTPIHSVHGEADKQKATPAVVTQGRTDDTQQRSSEHPFGPLSRATQSVMDYLSIRSLRPSDSVAVRTSAPSRAAAAEVVEVEQDIIEPVPGCLYPDYLYGG